MPTFHEEEVLRSGTLGFFKPHSLITKIESMADLSPEGESAPPQVVALHVHEYIHYLHNLTTIVGLSSLTSSFLLVHPLLTQMADNRIEEELEQHLLRAFTEIRSLKGYEEDIPEDYKWGKVKCWDFVKEGISFTDIANGAEEDPDQPIAFKTTATFTDGRILKFRLVPGLDFITEGIAYEIERDIRKRAGTSEYEVDLMTPSYPYLAFAPLVDQLAGRKLPSDERVFIGSVALLTSNPSASMTNICELHKFGEGTKQGKILEQMVGNIISGFAQYAEYVRVAIIPMFYSIFSGSPILVKGMEVYEKLILTALNSRLKHPLLELSFLRETMDKEGFEKIALNLLERVIFQGKPGFASEIKWIGRPGSVASYSSDMHEAFAVLQACIHYVQQHFKINRLETRESLKPTSCPFRGACKVEQDSGQPDICGSRPWLAESCEEIKEKCVYQAGIEAFKATVASKGATVDDSLPF
jgi:hypothetical protein